MATPDGGADGIVGPAPVAAYPSDEEPSSRDECAYDPSHPTTSPAAATTPPPAAAEALPTIFSDPGPHPLHVNLSSSSAASASGENFVAGPRDRDRRGARNDVFRPPPQNDLFDDDDDATTMTRSSAQDTDGHGRWHTTRTVSEGGLPPPPPRHSPVHLHHPRPPPAVGRGRAHTYSCGGGTTRPPRRDDAAPPHLSSPTGVARRIRLKSLDGAASELIRPSNSVANLPRPAVPIVPPHSSAGIAGRTAGGGGGCGGSGGRLSYPARAVLLTAGVYVFLVGNTTETSVGHRAGGLDLSQLRSRPNLRRNVGQGDERRQESRPSSVGGGVGHPDLGGGGREVTFRGMGMALSDDRPWLAVDVDDVEEKESDNKRDGGNNAAADRVSPGRTKQRLARTGPSDGRGASVPAPAAAAVQAVGTATTAKKKKRKPRLAHARAAAVMQAARPAAAAAAAASGTKKAAASAISPERRRRNDDVNDDHKRPRRRQQRRELPVFELSVEETANPSWRELVPASSSSGRYRRVFGAGGFGLWQWLGILSALASVAVLGIATAWGRFRTVVRG